MSITRYQGSAQTPKTVRKNPTNELLDDLKHKDLPTNVKTILNKMNGELVIKLSPSGNVMYIADKSNGKTIGTTDDLLKINRINTIVSAESKILAKAEKYSQTIHNVTVLFLQEKVEPAYKFNEVEIAKCALDLQRLSALEAFKAKLGAARNIEEISQRSLIISYVMNVESILRHRIFSIIRGEKSDIAEAIAAAGVPLFLFKKMTNSSTDFTSVKSLLYPSNFTGSGFRLTANELRNTELTTLLEKEGFIHAGLTACLRVILNQWIDPDDADTSQSVEIWIPPLVVEKRFIESLVKTKAKFSTIGFDKTMKDRAEKLNHWLQTIMFATTLKFENNIEIFGEICHRRLTQDDLLLKSMYTRIDEDLSRWNAEIHSVMIKYIFDEYAKEYPDQANRDLTRYPTRGFVRKFPAFNKKNPSGDTIDDKSIKEFTTKWLRKESSSTQKKKRLPAGNTRIPANIVKDMTTLGLNDSVTESVKAFLGGFSSTEALTAAYEMLASNLGLLLQDEVPDDGDDDHE